MIHVDVRGRKPDKAWQSKADAATKELMAAKTLAAKHAVIDKYAGLWGELKTHLSDITNKKCWYSESRDNYSHCHVDHFRPKKEAIGLDKKTDYGGYWWLAFEWTNYRYCGGAGNVRKNSYFAVKSNKAKTPKKSYEDEVIYFLDPTNIDDPLKLTFTEEGMAKPISSKNTDWDYIRADYTIYYLNLNFENLKEARKSVWKACSDLITEIQPLLDKEQLNPSAVRKQKIIGKMEELRKLVNPDSEFSATAKTCLFSSGLPWAMKIAA
jgi:uncharacterized protein (TIGR02646 family)